jgi:hypothetical protein
MPIYRPEEDMPAHLRLLTADPRWASSEDAA